MVVKTNSHFIVFSNLESLQFVIMSGWQNIAKSLFNLNNRRIFASVEKPQMEATTRVIRQYIEQVMDKRA